MHVRADGSSQKRQAERRVNIFQMHLQVLFPEIQGHFRSAFLFKLKYRENKQFIVERVEKGLHIAQRSLRRHFVSSNQLDWISQIVKSLKLAKIGNW